MDSATFEFNMGLKYNTTRNVCANALALMMRANYDDGDIAEFIVALFDIKARIPRVL